MDTHLLPLPADPPPLWDNTLLPTLFTGAGEQASYRFVEYFTARIRNPNTRQAYFRAVNRFSQWCALRNLELTQIVPVPDWLTVDRDALKGKVARIPSREEIQPMVNEQLIVELYSR